MKLFPKLAFMICVLLLGTTVGLTSAFYWMEHQSLKIQAEQERATILRQFSQIVHEAFLANDDLLVVKYVGWMLQWNPAVISAGVVGPTGETLAHSEPSRVGKPWQEEAVSIHAFVEKFPVRVGNHSVATISVTFSERYYDELIRDRLARLQKRIAQTAGACLTIGILMSLFLASSWTKPIAALAKAAGRIGRGHYDIDLTSTDRRRDELGFLSRAFLTMAYQLRQLEIMKEDFVSAVTHELRSPLGAIESYLNLIGDEMKDGISEDQWRLYLERLRLNTQRLTRFVNDLLDVAALERGKLTLQCQSADISALANDLIQFFQPTVMSKKLTATVDVAPGLPPVWMDPDKIRQVLTNLMANAVKFTPEGGRINITLRRDHDTVEVSVIDTGLGIALADQEKIFNKFEQVPGARRQVKGPKGTGLGLAISRALIELHGGQLHLVSRPGQGTRFFFALPLARIPQHSEGVLI